MFVTVQMNITDVMARLVGLVSAGDHWQRSLVELAARAATGKLTVAVFSCSAILM
jgi:hypothetical protein